MNNEISIGCRGHWLLSFAVTSNTLHNKQLSVHLLFAAKSNEWQLLWPSNYQTSSGACTISVHQSSSFVSIESDIRRPLQYWFFSSISLIIRNLIEYSILFYRTVCNSILLCLLLIMHRCSCVYARQTDTHCCIIR